MLGAGKMAESRVLPRFAGYWYDESCQGQLSMRTLEAIQNY